MDQNKIVERAIFWFLVFVLDITNRHRVEKSQQAFLILAGVKSFKSWYYVSTMMPNPRIREPVHVAWPWLDGRSQLNRCTGRVMTACISLCKRNFLGITPHHSTNTINNKLSNVKCNLKGTPDPVFSFTF